MASLRDYMYNPQWRATYRWGMNDPNMSYYGNWNYDDGGFIPIFTDSNNTNSVRMNRHGGILSAYDTGIVNPYKQNPVTSVLLEGCTDSTGAPDQCARAILKPGPQTYPQYTTLRRL